MGELFPVTACGTRATELGDYVVYENKMSSSYEVGVGPLGAITRDSHFELYFQCRTKTRQWSVCHKGLCASTSSLYIVLR
ncbi:hypothetical protein MHYP_G00203050 [Metynnis hypsauchen]